MTASIAKIRINELARELEVKAKAVIDYLVSIGIEDKKSHSSSLEGDLIDQVRKHFHEGPTVVEEAPNAAPEPARPEAVAEAKPTPAKTELRAEPKTATAAEAAKPATASTATQPLAAEARTGAPLRRPVSAPEPPPPPGKRVLRPPIRHHVEPVTA